MKTLIAVAVATVVSGAAFAHSINGNNGSYDASMNNAFIQDGRANAKGNGRAKGGFNFGMNFSGDADMDGDVVGNGYNAFRGDNYGRGYGYNTPYYTGHDFPAQH